MIFSGVKSSAMSKHSKVQPGDGDLLKDLSLYRQFNAEREEILKHKWIESEKAGRDIGFDEALTSWIVKHRTNWRKSRCTTEVVNTGISNPKL